MTLMDEKGIETELLEIFRRVFPDPIDVHALDRESSPHWDSLRHAELILAVQKKFGVRFSVLEVSRLSSFRDMLSAVVAKKT